MNFKIKRSFVTGDEWVYYKIYCGAKSSDYILIHHLIPILNLFVREKHIDSWFFIRYYDSDYHLRLRLHFREEISLLEIIKFLNSEFNKLIDLNLIWKVQLDTYNRELERYGFNLINQSEKIFFHDSIMILGALKIIENNKNPDLRWLFGLLVINSVMNDFEFSILQKKELMGLLQTSFGEEMGLDKNLRSQLNKKYKSYNREIYDFFKEGITNDKKLLQHLIDEKSNSIKQAVIEIKQSGIEIYELYNIVSSHIHMSMNRLFITKNRQSEFVCYYFLFSYYNSKIARAKYQK